MKKLFTLLFLLSFAFATPQASNAPNWTKTDCNGNSRTLYSYLDSNQVVALIFGMGCSSCTDAAGFFSSLKVKYNASHPGKFKAFYMDFFAGNTCANNVTPIVSGSALDAGFDNSSAELAAYTSASPMTYVVVVAGSSHSIIYSVKKYIFDYSDSVNIITAIDNYFYTVGIKELSETKNKIAAYPNPTHDKINFINKSGEAFSFSIYDLKGKLITDGNATEPKEKTINLESLSPGEYFLKIKYKSGLTETQKLIKN